MKLHIAFVAALLAASGILHSEDAPKTTPHSPEFEKIKSLVGTWHGKTDIGHGPVDMVVQYRVIAAGSVIEERVFADTPDEMVTMYYDKAGKLAATHYCILGNRPELALKTSSANSLTFDFDSCCGIDAKKEAHMHSMAIRFDDADTITTSCKALMDGKESPEHEITLTRVKNTTAANN